MIFCLKGPASSFSTSSISTASSRKTFRLQAHIAQRHTGLRSRESARRSEFSVRPVQSRNSPPAEYMRALYYWMYDSKVEAQVKLPADL
jgi:hypothetical protein